jgi:hypothetical protein
MSRLGVPPFVFFQEKNKSDKGAKHMSSSGIVDWLTILFFLWFGLKLFVPALNKGYFSILGGIIALAAALAIIVDRSP